MIIQEAFEILELPFSASRIEIKESHRKLIKNGHSDVENGNHDQAAIINNARDIALKYIDENANLVLIKQIVDVIKVDNNSSIKHLEYKSQSDTIYTKISRKIGSKYKSYRSTAKILGSFTAIIALLSSKFVPLLPEATKDPKLTLPFTVFAGMIGLYYLIINSFAERIQDAIDDLKDTLSDKASYLEILNNILQYQEERTLVVSRTEFEELCDKWFHSQRSLDASMDSTFNEMFGFYSSSFIKTARKIGLVDFIKYIISKGLEKNILIEKEYIDNGFPAIKYEINVKAST